MMNDWHETRGLPVPLISRAAARTHPGINSAIKRFACIDGLRKAGFFRNCEISTASQTPLLHISDTPRMEPHTQMIAR